MDLNTFMAILSVVAAGCSAGTAVFMYRFNKEQAEKKFKSDLYSTVVQLAGFANYVQNLYDFHSVMTESHAREIARQIRNVNKDIIDTTQSFYFNDMFSVEVKCKVNGFLESYIGWKAFRLIEYGEIFLETKNIYALQQVALDALNCIKEEYKSDSKITDMMKDILADYDYLYAQCKENNNRIRYIGNNLSFMFLTTPIVNYLRGSFNTEILEREEVHSNIVDACFGVFLNDKMCSKQYQDVIKFLFYSEIITCKRRLNQLVNNEGEEMSYTRIYDFFYAMIAEKYEQRINKRNEKI